MRMAAEYEDTHGGENACCGNSRKCHIAHAGCDQKDKGECSPKHLSDSQPESDKGHHVRPSREGSDVSLKNCLMRSLMTFRTSLTRLSFSPYVPVKEEGSSKLQCMRFEMPGKIGQRSPLASSQTVMT